MRTLRILLLALFHRHTPLKAKLAVIGAALYGVFPIDLIPDIIPFAGITDDLTVILFAIGLFLRHTKKLRKELNTDL